MKTSITYSIDRLLPEHQELWCAIWRAFPNYFSAPTTAAAIEKTWKKLIDPASGLYGIGAFHENVLLGIAHLAIHETTWSSSPSCMLLDLFVLPPIRRSGIGSQLLSAAFVEAHKHGAEHIYWIAELANAEARRFYANYAVKTGHCAFYESATRQQPAN
jgi:GNAT superfamily N-acetyltransferase